MAKMISGMMSLFIIMPIWFYLQYKILEAVNASELMWFLYWIYIPAAVIVQITSKALEEK